MNKKGFFAAWAVLLIGLIYSCSHRSRNELSITGKVSNPGSIRQVYLYQADSAGLSMVDSTSLGEDGQFRFHRHMPFADLFDIRIGHSVFDLIAKDGDQISFSTNLADTTGSYLVAGSEDSRKIREFNRINNSFNREITRITGQYRAAAQRLGHETDSLMRVYRPLYQKVLDAQSTAIIQFADANDSSLAGFYAITGLDPERYEQQLIAYADRIRGKFTDNPAVRRFRHTMDELRPVSIGHQAPEFSATGLDGRAVKLSDYRGKYVLLDFWASWCAPCRQENPNVVRLYHMYQPKGLHILGISLDEDKTSWQQAVQADKLGWSHVSDLKKFDGPTELKYHIQAIPSNFLIDPSGKIIAKNIFGNDLETMLRTTFSKDLK